MGYWLPAKKKNRIHAHVKATNRLMQRKLNQTFPVTTRQSRLSRKEKRGGGVGNVNETAEPVFPEAGSIIDPAAVPRLPFSS